MGVIKVMAEMSNTNSDLDAGVGALCVHNSVMGAFMNVRINASSYDDKSFVEDVLKKGREIERKAMEMESSILKVVNEKNFSETSQAFMINE